MDILAILPFFDTLLWLISSLEQVQNWEYWNVVLLLVIENSGSSALKQFVMPLGSYGFTQVIGGRGYKHCLRSQSECSFFKLWRLVERWYFWSEGRPPADCSRTTE